MGKGRGRVRGRGRGGRGQVVFFLCAVPGRWLPALRAEDVGLHFLEGVGHLGEGGDRGTGAVVAEIKRNGVEEIAEDAREGDENHAGTGEIKRGR